MEFTVCAFSASIYHAFKSGLLPAFRSKPASKAYLMAVLFAGASYISWRAVIVSPLAEQKLHCPSCLLLRGLILGGTMGMLISVVTERVARVSTRHGRLAGSIPRRTSMTPFVLGLLGMYLADRKGRATILKKWDP